MVELEGYEQVLTAVLELCEGRLALSGGEKNRDLVESYWQIGDLIVQAEGGGRGTRNSQVVSRLAAELSQRYGSGFSTVNLFAMRRFALAYGLADLSEPLTWSHYRHLAMVKDQQQRLKLEKRVRFGELSCRELALAVSTQRQIVQNGGAPGRIELPLGTINCGLYRLEIGTRGTVLDAGFGVKLPLPSTMEKTGLAQLPHRSIVRLGNSGQLEAVSLKHVQERFCYHAELVRVIDGDTLLVLVQLGQGVAIEQRFRLRFVDAPEIDSTEGEACLAYLAQLVTPGSGLIVWTFGTDSYGRYLVDVLVRKDLTETQGDLILLNEQVLNSPITGYRYRRWN